MGSVALRGRYWVAAACLPLAPAIVACNLVLTPTSVLAATFAPSCGHANSSNPGLHKGLVKNGCWPVPRPPSPPPTPAPKPLAGVGTPLGQIAGGPQAGGIPANTIPSPVAPSPPSAIGQPPPTLTAPASAPFRDRNLWIVIELLPTLLVLWLLLAGRAAAYGLRRRSQAATAS